MVTIVRKAGSATANLVNLISRICAIIIAPTTTSAAAATSSGTTLVSGVRNMEPRNSAPVTTDASPVRAPSPIPAAESMYTVLEEPDVAPPATAPTPSTMKADFSRGNVPSLCATPALFASPVRGPMASKKLVNTSVNPSTVAPRPPIRPKAPNRSNCPTRPRSGADTSWPDSTGVFRCQPPGLVSLAGPMCRMASTTAAIAAVVEAILHIGPASETNPGGWHLNTPVLSGQLVSAPDLGLVGQFDLFGAFGRIGGLAAP